MAAVRQFRNAFMADARVGGERRRQVFSTRAEAEAALREWGCDVPARALAAERNEGPTLAQVATAWVEWLQGNARPATVALAGQCFAAIERAAPELYQGHTLALRPADITRLKNALARGRRPATVAKILVRLRAALAWAARPPEGDGRREGGGLLDRPPVMVKPPRTAPPSPARVAERLVDDLTMARLFSGARDPRLRAAMALARYSGLRRGEILRLRLGDLDFDQGVVRVLGATKSHRERLAPLGPRGAEEIMRYLGSRAFRVPAGERKPSMLVFPGWTLSAIAQQVRRLARRTGWSSAKPGLHSLRATWATEVLARGTPLAVAQQAGGWSSLVSMQHYLGARGEALGRLAKIC